MIYSQIFSGFLMIGLAQGFGHLPDWEGRGKAESVAEVEVFLSPECPISKAQTPELKKLKADFPELVFRFYFPVQTTSEAEARAFCERYGLKGPVVLAPHAFERARALGATTLPECFALDSKRQVLYSGLIESSHSRAWKKRSSGSKPELRAALEALREGRMPENTRTQAVGCKITFPSAVQNPVQP